MAKIVALSPILADPSFPRSDQELQEVAISLGELTKLADEEKLKILNCEFFQMLVQSFRWEGGNTALKREIYQHLQLWFLTGQRFSEVVDFLRTGKFKHPLPLGSSIQTDCCSLWSEELGDLFQHHRRVISRGPPCVGIACDKAFSGGSIGQLDTQSGDFFPLVGPEEFVNCTPSKLRDSYDYDIPSSALQKPITFEQAKKNVRVLGDCVIDSPRRGSHFKVTFTKCQRPWMLDPNTDPIPERFLKQLCSITGFSLEVIIYSLSAGSLPQKKRII